MKDWGDKIVAAVNSAKSGTRKRKQPPTSDKGTESDRPRKRKKTFHHQTEHEESEHEDHHDDNGSNRSLPVTSDSGSDSGR
jgi:hypothetical protein